MPTHNDQFPSVNPWVIAAILVFLVVLGAAMAWQFKSAVIGAIVSFTGLVIVFHFTGVTRIAFRWFSLEWDIRKEAPRQGGGDDSPDENTKMRKSDI